MYCDSKRRTVEPEPSALSDRDAGAPLPSMSAWKRKFCCSRALSGGAVSVADSAHARRAAAARKYQLASMLRLPSLQSVPTGGAAGCRAAEDEPRFASVPFTPPLAVTALSLRPQKLDPRKQDALLRHALVPRKDWQCRTVFGDDVAAVVFHLPNNIHVGKIWFARIEISKPPPKDFRDTKSRASSVRAREIPPLKGFMSSLN
eukprot:scaffold24427_cov55-Phaeocystis_antarctica.AAC.5